MVNLSNTQILYALGLSAVFLFGFLAISFLYAYLLAPLRRRRHLRERVERIQKEIHLRAQVFKAEQIKDSLLVKVIDSVGGRGRLEALQRQLRQADLYWSVGFFLAVVAALALGGFVVGDWLGQGWLGGGVAAVVMVLLPFLFIKLKRDHKSALVEKQMPEVMELLARSLRAGHTLSSAIELASKETPHPLGTELRITYEEQRLGISLPEALQHMAKRVGSRDLRYFVTGVLIQTETGGNLAEVMEKIGLLIRERLKVKGKIQGLTAEGRLSGVILGILPVAMFCFLYLFERSYIMTLVQEPLGRKLLTAGAVSIMLGAMAIKRITRIDF
jgi:tight adherence protein B